MVLESCLTYEKIFWLVSERMEVRLNENGFKTENKKDKHGMKKIYIKEDFYYEVSYNFSSKTFILKDSEKIISSWYFDSSDNLEKQAKSIACDFLEVMGIFDFSSKMKNKSKPKKQKTENSENDPIFLINKIAGIFPELKEKMQKEKDMYEDFRPVTFTKEYVFPIIQDFLSNNPDKNRLKKMSSVFNSLYENGSLDTRSIINIIILSPLESIESLKEYLDENLKKTVCATQKIKNKKITPERPKKFKSFLSSILNEYHNKQEEKF